MRVTVFGSARLGEDTDEYVEARRLGRMLAERGHVIVSGGYGGIMEAVSRGAHEIGGQVVGVTVAPWVGRLSPNPYLSEERSAQTLFERLEALVESDGLIALPGGAGTLGEVALAWNLRQMDLMPAKPVILVGEPWRHMIAAFEELLIVDERDLRLLTLVAGVDEALEALEAAGDGAAGRWLG
jgi:uncharacterized protein (TIGR00730 family)